MDDRLTSATLWTSHPADHQDTVHIDLSRVTVVRPVPLHDPMPNFAALAVDGQEFIVKGSVETWVLHVNSAKDRACSRRVV